MLRKLRALCLSLPETTEVASWGHPNFRAGRKIFVALETYKGIFSIAFRLTPSEQEILLSDPRFYLTPYVGHRGWVSLKVDGRLDWDLVRDLAVRAYRHAALKRMLAALDARER